MELRMTSAERVMIALLEPKPNNREELLQTLHSLLEQARTETGSLQALVSQAIDGSNLLLLYMEWKDAASLSAYMGTEGFKVLLGAAGTLSVPARFHFLADSSGHSAEVTGSIRSLGPVAGPRP